MSMSAQLAYEQILYESAANEATGEVWLKKEERQSMSITQFYASNIAANTDTWDYQTKIRNSLEKKKDSICTDAHKSSIANFPWA